MTDLMPSAKRSRWQPIRSGLINLFHYADEQFWYEDGRMLLRGNNGTGKSRVLALQLPFLLDAELSPTRMEPDRSSSKRPEWNLLLGGKHRDRLGYTWIEFGRLDDDDQPQYFTLGCGMHAVEHRGAADAWFFTLDGRIGEDLDLVVDSVPLSKSRLNETLSRLPGDRSRIYARQGDYRRAVDETLFRLGNRYRSLIDLLIQLRVPQLSRDFDEQRMSAQLSTALPPLPVDVLTQVADAMKDLDEQRERLEELRRSGAGAQRFSEHYRRYLQIALRRRVDELSSEHNRYERSLRSINDTTRQLEEATQAFEQTMLEQTQAETDRRKTRAALDALRSRPEMKDALRLDDMRRSCVSLSKAEDQANVERERAAERLAETSKRLRNEADELKYAIRRTETRIETLVSLDTPANLKDRFIDRSPDLLTHDSLSKPLSEIEQQINLCQTGLERLRKAEVEITRATTTVEQELKTQGLFETQVEEATASLAQRQAQVDLARQTLRDQLAHWSRESQSVITHPDLGEELAVESEFEDETFEDDAVQNETRETEENPRETAWSIVKPAIDAALARIATEKQRLAWQAESLRENLDELNTQRERLRSGGHQPPPIPHTRDVDVRSTRAGAPLYELCDFRDEVPEKERGDWEAALEASGLLDAFVTLDGTLTGNGIDDVTLLAGKPIANAEQQLSRVLRVAETLPEGMHPDVVRRLLECIGCGRDAADAWVDRDGSWRIGPAHGHWSKPIAEHVGATAREQHRLRLIESITQQIQTIESELRLIESQRQLLDDQQTQINRQVETFPSDRELLDALVQARSAHDVLSRSESRLSDQLSIVTRARATLSQLVARRDRDAADLGMTDWLDDLERLRQSLQSFSGNFESLRRDLQDVSRHRATHDRYLGDHHAATETDRQRSEQLQHARDDLAAKQTELETLQQNVGASVQEIQDKIAENERLEQSLDERLKQLQNTLSERATAKGKLEGSLETSREVLRRHESDRESAILRVSQLADAGLAQIAVTQDLPDSPWSPTRAAHIAKAIRSELPNTPTSDDVWNDSQNTIQVEFRSLENALLPTGNTPQSQTQDDLVVVTIPFGGVVCSPTTLATQLAEEIRHHETVITQRERELFEERLIGDIAQSLHLNIRDAHSLCQSMNEEVESRPMSTGMRLRFKWKPIQEGADDIKVACAALLRKPSAMSPADRTALGGFLQRQIQEARNRDDAGTWQQHLAEALDYRTWFSFDIERETDGRWQRLTKRTHGTGSGGERAVALIIPMLAALSAYYHSADSIAPRIVLMDEAFVGIDNEMRAKFMDLLVQFDLDFVMTSEREWGCYPTMPSLAIYHLATRRGIDAILPTRWVWNGNGKRVDDSHERMRQASLFDEEAANDE
ncbi:TIGR02680 family protein [Neorhodopirellula pilleata]|uniref:Chromosome partition protein Smc n=1 Tax=Neorhodopirellula pilleata TaxID=2714738 RepID=A0A5C6ADH3_9BACT|nr:TIGR02680 family protein [Neorhodopirellula pilleata]TWT97348.1 Chromosome partition protein Smc [Neorhodopirellula pilleata]